MKKFLFAFFVGILLLGCASREKDLDRAESLLQEHPDSALYIIKTYADKTESLSKGEYARYCLLYCAACDKNYIDLTSDSTIIIAVNYFADKAGKYRYLSNYYHGIALKNMKKYQPAIVAFEKAGNEAFQFEDYLYSGLSERNKANIFNVIGNNIAAQNYHKKAIASFDKIPNKSYLHYAIFGLAIDYYNNHEHELALHLIDSINTLSLDANLTSRSRLLKATMTAQKNENPENSIELYRSIDPRYYSFIDYGLLAIAYEEVGDKDSADYWMRKGYDLTNSNTGKATLDHINSKLESIRGNYKSAYELIENTIHVQDSLTRARLQESASTAQRDYYQQELLLQEQKAQTKAAQYRLTLSVILLVLLILAAGFIIYSRWKEQQYREALATLNASEEKLQILIKDSANLLGESLSNKLLYLEQLSNDYYQTDSERTRNTVYRNYKETLRNIQNNPTLFSDIENSLNHYCNNLMIRFKEQFPEIKGEKFHLAMAFFTGMPYNAVQLLFKNHSIDSLKMTKNRLKKRINESDSQDKDDFLDMLEMKKGGRR